MSDAQISLVGPRKVRISPEGVRLFNAQLPGSTLCPSRAYWFEFDERGVLIDTDCPEQDDGPAAANMAEDCVRWLQDDELPQWLR